MNITEKTKARALLAALIKAGDVQVTPGGEVIGLASDGVLVTLGNDTSDRDRESLYSYLLFHPRPTTW